MDLVSSLQEENRLNRPGYSFTEAIRISEELLGELDRNGSAVSEAGQKIVALISSAPGARGFFVTFLTGDFALSEKPPAVLIEALNQQPEPACDILVRNLVMSTAMAVTHERNGDREAVDGSRRVAVRTARLIGQLPIAEMKERLSEMKAAMSYQSGIYTDFLKKWGYDQEQLAKVQTAVESCLKSLTAAVDLEGLERS